MEVKNLWEVVLPRLRSSIGVSLSIEQVAEFCHVSPKTVRRWVEDESPANGEHLIRLWHLLAFVGNESPELEALKPLQRFVSGLFGFDVIGAVKACEILNLNPQKPSYMYQILRGSEVSKPRYTYDELVSLYVDDLMAMKEIVREQLLHNSLAGQPLVGEESAAEVLATPVVIMPREAPAVMPLQGDASVLLASLVSAIEPVADALLSEDATIEERTRFRELVTNQRLFDVTNKLNALSSERARNKR